MHLVCLTSNNILDKVVEAVIINWRGHCCGVICRVSQGILDEDFSVRMRCASQARARVSSSLRLLEASRLFALFVGAWRRVTQTR